MLAIERRNAMLNALSIEGKVVVSELAKQFGVTEETIRRDIEKLEKEGKAKKTYGGAVSNVAPSIDLPYNVRKKENTDLKQIIAENVAAMIKDGDHIMLDASSIASLAFFSDSAISNRLNRMKKKRIIIITSSNDVKSGLNTLFFMINPFNKKIFSSIRIVYLQQFLFWFARKH